MPILLVLILVLMHVTRIMLVKMQVVDEARITAWEESLGTPSRSLNRFELTLSLSGDPIISGSENLDDDQAGFLSRMRHAGERKYGSSSTLTQVLEANDHGILLTSAKSFYVAHPKLERWNFLIADNYAIVGTSIWKGEDMPIGYDNYMRSTLNSRVLFPRYFPCASGPANSAASSCN